MRSRCRCSMCPAIHINSRSWLRSSSTHEPSDPPLRVVILRRRSDRRLDTAAHAQATIERAVTGMVCKEMNNEQKRARKRHIEGRARGTRPKQACRASLNRQRADTALRRYPRVRVAETAGAGGGQKLPHYTIKRVTRGTFNSRSYGVTGTPRASLTAQW